jgi:hypothetical protein
MKRCIIGLSMLLVLGGCHASLEGGGMKQRSSPPTLTNGGFDVLTFDDGTPPVVKHVPSILQQGVGVAGGVGDALNGALRPDETYAETYYFQTGRPRFYERPPRRRWVTPPGQTKKHPF